MGVSDYIAAIAPSLASDSRVATFQAVAMNNISRCQFQDNYEYAVALLVCHLLARNPTKGQGRPGAVTAAQEGGVSESYAISEDLKRKYSDWTSTSYGCQLAQLAEGQIVGQVAVGGSGMQIQVTSDIPG